MRITSARPQLPGTDPAMSSASSVIVTFRRNSPPGAELGADEGQMAVGGQAKEQLVAKRQKLVSGTVRGFVQSGSSVFVYERVLADREIRLISGKCQPTSQIAGCRRP